MRNVSVDLHTNRDSDRFESEDLHLLARDQESNWVKIIVPLSHLYDRYEEHARALLGSGGYMSGILQISLYFISISLKARRYPNFAPSTLFRDLKEHMRRFMIESDLWASTDGAYDSVIDDRLLYGLIDLTGELQVRLEEQFMSIFGQIPTNIRYESMLGRDLVVAYPLPTN